MRSEKEIREIYNLVIENIRYDVERPFEGINGFGEYWHHHCTEYDKSSFGDIFILLDYFENKLDEHLKIIQREKLSSLEGEPRYSIQEIPKDKFVHVLAEGATMIECAELSKRLYEAGVSGFVTNQKLEIGEPRYSESELALIASKIEEMEVCDYDARALFNYLRENPDKVKQILEGKKWK